MHAVEMNMQLLKGDPSVGSSPTPDLGSATPSTVDLVLVKELSQTVFTFTQDEVRLHVGAGPHVSDSCRYAVRSGHWSNGKESFQLQDLSWSRPTQPVATIL